MLYKAGGHEQIHGGSFASLIVRNADELEAALADGWFKTTPEATDAVKPTPAPTPEPTAAPTPAPTSAPEDETPPTRDELKQKADELGLQYPGNIPTAKLAEMVEAALADGDKQED